MKEAPETIHNRTITHLLLLVAGIAALQVFLHRYVAARPPMQNVQWWQTLAGVVAKHGFFHVWTPYPPVFPSIFYAVHALAPASAIQPVWMACNAMLLLAQAALIFALVRETENDRLRATHSGLLAAVAFLAVMMAPRSLVLLGPWMDQFDYLPACILLGALLLLVRGKHTASAVLCGIGIMTKLFPAVLIPVALVTLGWKRGLAYAGIAAAVCVAIAAPFLIADADTFLSTPRWSAARIPWESTWAWMSPGRGTRYPVANLPDIPGPQVIEQHFALAYPAEDDLDTPPNVVHMHLLTTGLTAAFTLVAAFFFARRRRRDPVYDRHGNARSACRMALLFLLILLIFSKGFSSYFLVWAAPLICVAYPGAPGFALCGVLVVLGNTQLLGLLGESLNIAIARAKFEGGDIRNLADYLNSCTRLGSPYVLFWRSIWFRWLALIAIAGFQLYSLLARSETTE